MDNMTEKIEGLLAVLRIMDTMYDFKKTDYGKGIVQGITMTVRSLGLEKEMSEAAAAAAKENGDGTLSDRME